MSSTTTTFRLFKERLSFMGGIAAVIDNSQIQSRYNIDKTEKEADIKSLYADWLAIGEDMQKAIDTYASTESK